ncbi:MAG: hypothetical protein COB09_19160 [Thalassobium sp.]|nr:MAG: hypothetical protein COB09_19160 [Thalassobium sp.]
MTILPVNNIINVSILNTPSGLTEKNINSLALFTTETPSNLDAFRTYVGAAQVALDYGTNSETAAMANAIFSQAPNIRTGRGRLVILPLVASVSATQGTWATTNISANLASIIAVADGDIRVTIDTVDYDLTNLNFTGASTIADIVTILQNALVNGIVTDDTTGFTVTSKKVGAASDVVLVQLPAGLGTDMSVVGLFDTAGGAAVSGVDASGETIAAAITRTEGAVGYVPIITNLEMEDAVIVTLANTIQARDNMFLHQVSSTEDIAGIVTTISQAGNTKTRLLLYTESPSLGNLFKSAYAGRGYSVNFSGTDTSQTMQLKELATITPDTGINQTIYDLAKIAGCDMYVSFDGVPSVESTGGNDYFDNPYNDLAVKFALEVAGFNYLRQTNTKIPQTESGMDGLKAAYGNVCERFIRNGVLAAGAWTSSETFGDPDIFRANVLDKGYYIFSISILLQPAPEREAREAPLVQIALKRAGAIHHSDVIVLVND